MVPEGDRTDGENPSVTVVLSVAAHSNSKTSDLPPLTDVVDPDALDKFIFSMNEGSVTFPYADFRVTVDADGSVSVEPTEDRSSTEN